MIKEKMQLIRMKMNLDLARDLPVTTKLMRNPQF